MMKKKGIIIIGVILVLISILFFFLREGLLLMDIEDRYGDLQELYYSIDEDEKYIVIFENEECGFVEKLERNIYFSEGGCLKSILNYSNQKMEVYKIEITESYTDFDINEAIALKNKSTSKLIYKN